MSSTARRTALAVVLTTALALTGCSGPAGTPDGRDSPDEQVRDVVLPQGVGYRTFVRKLDGRSPSHVHVLTIAPDARARVGGLHGANLASAETVREMAGSAGALAAVNASYFDIHTGKYYSGYEGDPLGLYAEGGKVLSEATNGRPALLLGYTGGRLDARVDEITTEEQVTSDDGEAHELDGFNRVPGRVLGCGGVGGDRLSDTEEPMQEPYGGLCTDTSELVVFTQEWGDWTPPGPPGSMEALLDADGRVVGVRKPAGGSMPKNGSTLYAIGSGVDWLRTHAPKGSVVTPSVRMKDAMGRTVPGPVDTAVGGRYRLLRDGVSALGENAALTRRAPRTAAGVTADGTLLLVTVDGRESRVSAGATLSEAADLMASLGAENAVGLDGGGSTTVVVGGKLRNRPRETAGQPVTERPVANALALFDH
ncbi:phosphodiester glycosidase family protein [Streptomyces sp. NBC_00539]|uniref:phosphodiester glycosidase family protein n=1 Tax=Streptomyces sp. NBC_00539 TaxID=2975770 RepID=UPI002E80B176|nr:phosphodiester glycosidase family protein [Streptomyces sp. NBC_00539]WUC64116.1 phosphodiester glycosidase family protein [Streptomyces sp. NBC_00539]